MRKFLLAFLVVIPVSSATTPIVSSQVTKHNNVHYVNENIYLDNKDQKLTADETFFNLNGNNYQTIHRIYISSNKDKSLPEKANTVDYIIGKGKKDTWYNQSFSGLSLDITNYVTNKTEFLDRYKSVNITYSYMDNFWNSWNGWTNKYKKDPPISTGVYTFNLKSSNETIAILQNTDPSHKSNEKVRLVLEQSWNGNILNLNWKLGVWYHWAKLSIYNHAALASFTHDSYTFLEIPTDNIKPSVEPKIDTIVKASTFTLLGTNKASGLNNVDNELRVKAKQEDIKNSFFKIVSTIVQSYFGVKTVPTWDGVWVYTLGVVMIWYPNSIAAIESGMILSSVLNVNFDRTFGIDSTGTLYRMSYESDSGTKEYGNYQPLYSTYLGMKLAGVITMPYIYVD